VSAISGTFLETRGEGLRSGDAEAVAPWTGRAELESATALAVVGTLAMSLTIETMTTKAAAVTQASKQSISRCQRRLRRRRRALRSRTSKSQSGDGISMPSG